MIYELWDIRTNNILDAYDSRVEAIEALRAAADEHGDNAFEFLMLLEDDPKADAKKIIGIGSEILIHIRNAA